VSYVSGNDDIRDRDADEALRGKLRNSITILKGWIKASTERIENLTREIAQLENNLENKRILLHSNQLDINSYEIQIKMLEEKLKERWIK